MRRILLTAALIVVLSPPAFGGYVSNYAGWRALSAGQKLGYVMGAFDLGLNTSSDDDPYGEANSRGVTSCSQELKLDSGMLVQLVENSLHSEPD